MVIKKNNKYKLVWCIIRYIIAWMLNQIFIYYDTFMLAAGLNNDTPSSPLLLDERTEKLN